LSEFKKFINLKPICPIQRCAGFAFRSPLPHHLITEGICGRVGGLSPAWHQRGQRGIYEEITGFKPMPSEEGIQEEKASGFWPQHICQSQRVHGRQRGIQKDASRMDYALEMGHFGTIKRNALLKYYFGMGKKTKKVFFTISDKFLGRFNQLN
jgi:hypothetical protein